MNNTQFVWPKDEKLVFVRLPNEEYYGKLEYFYDSTCFPELNPLKENWKAIRDEILNFETENGKLNRMDAVTPANAYGGNWTFIYLMGFLRKYHKNRLDFPVICSIVDKIPNVVLTSISILPPNTEIPPHYGDTNGIIRTHLSLIIPAEYPEIAIKVGDQERGWKEGEIMCFVNVHLHSVWNKSPYRRYILMVDIVPKVLEHRKFEICARGLGSQSFNYFWKVFPILKYTPNFVHEMIVFFASIIWWIYLPIQRRVSFLP